MWPTWLLTMNPQFVHVVRRVFPLNQVYFVNTNVFSGEAKFKLVFLNLFQLSSEDIPGSMIFRADLEKCTKSELKLWLNCRGLRYKSTETRAELLSR